MKDFLVIDKMITPKIITVIYWLMLLGVVLMGVKGMFGFGGFSLTKAIWSLGYIVFGALMARVFCELMIVMFKVNDALQDIRKKGSM